MIAPGLRIGRYEIGKRLGKGGFGVVHVARDLDLDREIAIKVLKPEYLSRPQIVQRFIQEARAAARIGHPGIVTVFECGQIQGTGTVDDGNAYIAMELLVGQSLSDRLLDSRMALSQAIAITRQLAAALAAAHAAGIVHRDLKPDNVFLVPDAAVHGGERVKILDFGVAKLLEPSEDGVNTHSQMMLGTPRYMSPEQARSAAKVDHRADIYTLGCMMFEMVTGRSPFTGDSGEQLIAHQKTPPPSARALAPSLPAAIDALITRMLAKAPTERPQSMTEVGDALADTNDEPDTVVHAPLERGRVSAEITTVAETTVRPRDRRVLYAAAGLSALAIVVVTALVLSRRGPREQPAPAPVASADAAPVVADAAIAIAPAPHPEADARVIAENAPAIDEDVSRLKLVCAEANDKRRWSELVDCADQLSKFDKATGERMHVLAISEQRAEAAARAVERGVTEGNWKSMKSALDSIGVDSVYRKDAEDAVKDAEYRATRKLVGDLTAARTASPRCMAYDALLRRATSTLPRNVVEAAKREVSCAGSNAKATASDATIADCANADDTFARGMEAFSNSSPDKALPLFEAAYKCKGDANTLKLVFASACKATNPAKAKSAWKKMSRSLQDSVLPFCVGNGITVDVLNAP